MNINQILRDYELNEQDLVCISIFLHTEAKLFAWSQTIGKDSKAKYKDTMSSRWFAQEKIEKYLFDHRNKTKIKQEAKVIKEGKRLDAINSNVTYVTNTNEHEITTENIKAKLEHELRYVQDPAQRATILIKIAEFTGLRNSNEADPLTPTIYLPSRCANCKISGGQGK